MKILLENFNKKVLVRKSPEFSDPFTVAPDTVVSYAYSPKYAF